MIRIVNWLLTRRCNLSCEYCGIIRRSKSKIKHDLKYELPASEVIKLLDKFKIYNPNLFHIFYGGEPFLRSDLSDIIKFCNEKDILYTIISNSTRELHSIIFDVMEKAGGFRGYSASVDPIVLMEPTSKTSQLKSGAGFGFLLKMARYVDDVVAEVTMTRYNLRYTYDLIRMLSDSGIYSSLTAIDINKNYMYDFSAYSAESKLIQHTPSLHKLYNKLMSNDNLLIHMKQEILPILFKHIDSTYDCELEKSVHNITIDSDGCLRTCLRIGGGSTIRNVNYKTLFKSNELNKILLKNRISIEKKSYCKGCNHTCMMMSKYIDNNENEQNKIISH